MRLHTNTPAAVAARLATRLAVAAATKAAQAPYTPIWFSYAPHTGRAVLHKADVMHKC
jgi:negative regulator of replication initiation